MIEFLHTFLPQPVMFQWQFIRIHWYGLFIVLGIVAALTVILKLAKSQKIKSDEVYDLAFYALIFGLIGARLYAIGLDWEYYLKYPGEMIAIWRGGLAIHGAIIGGLAAAIIYCWQYDKPLWLLADLAAPGLAFAQSIGRWGNYFNQEVFGLPTGLPWGIPIQLANRPLQYLGSEYFHPTFLYESALNFLNFLVLYILFKRIYVLAKGKWPRVSGQSGFIFLVYLINYSIIRFAMEFIRSDETLMIFGWRWPQVFSALIILVCGLIIFYRLRGKPIK